MMTSQRAVKPEFGIDAMDPAYFYTVADRNRKRRRHAKQAMM
jgi:hypothetical protein